MFDEGTLRLALTAVGELLSADGERIAIVVTGGATLSLRGLVGRTTTDVDVIARGHKDQAETPYRLVEADPLPDTLVKAIDTVARDLGMASDWMNTVIGRQWDHGFPPSMEEELEWTNFGGGLDVGLVGRRTLIALKLYASADQDSRSVHFQDLTALDPTPMELSEARKWVVTQDTSPHWPGLIDEVIADVF